MSFLKLPFHQRAGFQRVPSSASLEEEHDAEADVAMSERPWPSSSSSSVPSSSSNPTYSTLRSSSSRTLSSFILAQVALLVVGFLVFARTGPPPPGELLQHHPDLGPGEESPKAWSEMYGGDPPEPRSDHFSGYEEVCQGGFGRQVCERYGSHNVKMSRSYEGTSSRIRETFRRIQEDGAPLRIAALGGSITGGHGIGNMGAPGIWVQNIFDNFNKIYPHPDNSFRNAAVGAVGSDFFSACWENRIHKEEVDLIFIELGINDLYEFSSSLSFEDLLRGVLSLPQRPAVVVARSIGLESEMLAVGGDEHLPIAVYYDTPVISLRPIILPTLVEDPSRLKEYFVLTDEGNPDTRHINERGHKALGDLTSNFLLEQWNVATRELKTYEATGVEVWADPKMPPEYTINWPSIDTLGNVPKLRLFGHFSPEKPVVPFHPQCLSMIQDEYSTNPLEPAIVETHGWVKWTPPQTPDKTYLWADHAGAVVTFELDVTGGKIEIFYLKSQDPDYRLGDVTCWVDDDEANGKSFAGYWTRWENIGQFGIVAEGLEPGKHRLSCRTLEESSNPNGGNEFRIISVVAL